jgi:hypothetical protein
VGRTHRSAMAATPGSRPSRPGPAPSPQEIAPGVFLGGWGDAARFEGQRFCVLDEAPEGLPGVRHLAVYDAEHDRPDIGHLEQIAREVRESRDHGSRVLIFCGHGIRRSPLAAAWYLHRYEHLTVAQAYERIRALRPKVELAGDWIAHVDELSV